MEEASNSTALKTSMGKESLSSFDVQGAIIYIERYFCIFYDLELEMMQSHPRLKLSGSWRPPWHVNDLFMLEPDVILLIIFT